MSISIRTFSHGIVLAASGFAAMAAGGCANDHATPRVRSDAMMESKSFDGTTTTKFEVSQSPKTVYEVLDRLVKEDRSFTYDVNKFLGGGGEYQGSLLCKTQDGGRFRVVAERVAAGKTDVYLTTTLGEFARTELIKRIKAEAAAKGD